ncbi:NUDIX domain protein [Aspergillus sclerotialis]|uniref:NUDIX domain protein n=1 Tax=Aspergillus sclerotialis TaxID=2070753 RepID=A0A3A2ZTD5_9EURO|nr:NUDIX domain protein [Aspergillus sclerotialis]
MATSKYLTTQYTSENFVESSGAILFDLSHETKRVCLIHYIVKDEWLLAKGRRNCGESRRDAALREVEKETGYKCHIHPVTMSTRAPRATEADDVSDQARSYPDLSEPFMSLFASWVKDQTQKLIWWYIAAVDEEPSDSRPSADCNFTAEFFTYDEALQKLTFQDDRNVLARAITLVESP